MGGRRHRRLAHAQDVFAYLPERESRSAGAGLDPGGQLHQVGSHPVVPGFWCTGRRGVLGQHAQ